MAVLKSNGDTDKKSIYKEGICAYLSFTSWFWSTAMWYPRETEYFLGKKRQSIKFDQKSMRPSILQPKDNLIKRLIHERGRRVVSITISTLVA